MLKVEPAVGNELLLHQMTELAKHFSFVCKYCPQSSSSTLPYTFETFWGYLSSYSFFSENYSAPTSSTMFPLYDSPSSPLVKWLEQLVRPESFSKSAGPVKLFLGSELTHGNSNGRTLVKRVLDFCLWGCLDASPPRGLGSAFLWILCETTLTFP